MSRWIGAALVLALLGCGGPLLMFPGGRLYIDPKEGRRWLEYIRADPHVRVRFGGKIYSARAVLVEDPVELEGFSEDRFVYRLDGIEPPSGTAP